MKALILCGGRGTRLRPYTMVIPKPLMPIGDLPILEVLLRQLREANITEIILAIGHMGQLFRAFFEDGSRLGVRIQYVAEDKPLGTAGAVATSLPHLGEDFLVMNGDLLTTLNFRRLLDAHDRSRPAATIGLFRRQVKIDFGVVEADSSGALIRYTEKPTFDFDVSMGINILNRASIADQLSPGEYLDMPDLLQRLVADGKRVETFRHDCLWLDIGRVDDYQLATELFLQRRNEFLPT